LASTGQTLADAFAAHAKARAALANGNDPQSDKIEAREAVKNALPFREVRERFATGVIKGQRVGISAPSCSNAPGGASDGTTSGSARSPTTRRLRGDSVGCRSIATRSAGACENTNTVKVRSK